MNLTKITIDTEDLVDAIQHHEDLLGLLSAVLTSYERHEPRDYTEVALRESSRLIRTAHERREREQRRKTFAMCCSGITYGQPPLPGCKSPELHVAPEPEGSQEVAIAIAREQE